MCVCVCVCVCRVRERERERVREREREQERERYKYVYVHTYTYAGARATWATSPPQQSVELHSFPPSTPARDDSDVPTFGGGGGGIWGGHAGGSGVGGSSGRVCRRKVLDADKSTLLYYTLFTTHSVLHNVCTARSLRHTLYCTLYAWQVIGLF